MPLGGHFKLSLKDCSVRDCDVERMSKVPYANAVGSLMYLMVCTRPDITYAVSVVSRYLVNPGKNHWEAVKWILKYLRGTANVGLVYGTDRGNHVDVTGFIDSNYAKDPDKGRSITGYAFLVQGCVVCWKATLQHVVALSTTEVEYMALTEAVKEAIWLRGVLEELGVGIKHINVRYHFIREVLEAKTIKVLKVARNDFSRVLGDQGKLGKLLVHWVKVWFDLWCQCVRQDHGLHELINMSANTKRYRISCNDLTRFFVLSQRGDYIIFRDCVTHAPSASGFNYVALIELQFKAYHGCIPVGLKSYWKSDLKYSSVMKSFVKFAEEIFRGLLESLGHVENITFGDYCLEEQGSVCATKDRDNKCLSLLSVCFEHQGSSSHRLKRLRGRLNFMGVRTKLETLERLTKSLANKLYLKKKLYTLYMPAGRKISEHIDEFNKIVLDLANIEFEGRTELGITSFKGESQDEGDDGDEHTSQALLACDHGFRMFIPITPGIIPELKRTDIAGGTLKKREGIKAYTLWMAHAMAVSLMLVLKKGAVLHSYGLKD
ncbi:hypothetical protein Tco_0117008 [Tanacetum coccineum]